MASANGTVSGKAKIVDPEGIVFNESAYSACSIFWRKKSRNRLKQCQDWLRTLVFVHAGFRG